MHKAVGSVARTIKPLTLDLDVFAIAEESTLPVVVHVQTVIENPFSCPVNFYDFQMWGKDMGDVHWLYSKVEEKKIGRGQSLGDLSSKSTF